MEHEEKQAVENDAEVGNGGRRKSVAEQLAEKGVDVSQAKDGIQVAQVLDIQVTHEETARVLSKIDRTILPLMGFCYMLQFMDKVSLGYSTQLGLIKDLGLVGTDYSWAGSIFYFGYLVWEMPSSYLAVRIPLGKYLSVTVVLWGIVLMCHGATHNFATLATARIFLGVMEACVAPGFALITGMFYTRSEQPSRQSWWYTGNSVANIISGVIAYGIGHINSPLAAWRCLFLILGGITAGYGFVLFFFLPDSVSKAKFLNPDEKAIAVRRVLINKTGVMDEGNYKVDQLWDALKDPQAWLLFLYNLSVSIPNGGITNFNSIIVAGFGFSPLNALLVQMPSGAFQLIALLVSSLLVTYLKVPRVAVMISMVLVSLIGMIVVITVPNSNPYGRLVGIWLTAPFAANIPLGLSLITSNVGGFTKRATVSGMLFVGYCVGNIIGPQFFYTYESPSYPTGLKATLSGFALGVFFLALLLAYYIIENKRRDRKYGLPSDVSETDDLAADLSNKTDRQIESFRYTI